MEVWFGSCIVCYTNSTFTINNDASLVVLDNNMTLFNTLAEVLA